MRILVAIANHGTKNRRYLDQLLSSYRSMPFDVDVVVLSDAPKPDLGDDVEVRVGAPTSNPWSLPFAHRALFAERADDYDLYLYSEDDTLVETRHIEAFLEADALLGADEVPGFLRFEEHPGGERSYCSVHSAYSWEPASVRKIAGEVFAEFSNQHSACYLLTRDQLKRAIDSGGFLVEPHEGLYDMLVSAATDPYVRCGLRRVVCVSRIEDFLLHHLPNVYLGKLGISEADWSAQLGALAAIAEGEVGSGRLFETRARMDTAAWDRHYHPQPASDLVSLLWRPASTVLSVGCGDGMLEQALFGRADHLVGMPLDEVIAAVARGRGIETLPADFEAAFEALDGRQFDVVLLHDVLGHVRDPVALLRDLRTVVAPAGELLVTLPNHRYHALRLLTRRPFSAPVPRRGAFEEVGVHRTGRRALRRWLEQAGYDITRFHHRHGRKVAGVARRVPVLRGVLGRTVVASASPRAGAAVRASAP